MSCYEFFKNSADQGIISDARAQELSSIYSQIPSGEQSSLLVALMMEQQSANYFDRFIADQVLEGNGEFRVLSPPEESRKAIVTAQNGEARFSFNTFPTEDSSHIVPQDSNFFLYAPALFQVRVFAPEGVNIYVSYFR